MGAAWWLLCYGIFVALNVWGVEMTFHVSVVVTLIALAVLAVFWVGAVPHFDLPRWASPYFPGGALQSVFRNRRTPFRALALSRDRATAARRRREPRPEARYAARHSLGLVTLIVVSFLTVVLSAGMAPGAAKVAASNEPLFLGFQTIFGQGLKTRVLALLACAGLIASFHTIIFAYGRQIYSLSRAGYFPTWLSVTHGTRETPQRALLCGSALGFLVALAIHLTPQGSPVGAVLLNMAVFGAVIAYILQMVSFIVLRLRFPRMERPYRSPAGIAGAALALGVAAVTLVRSLLESGLQQGRHRRGHLVLAAASLYYAAWARHRLVLAPEEQSALDHRKERGE